MLATRSSMKHETPTYNVYATNFLQELDACATEIIFARSYNIDRAICDPIQLGQFNWVWSKGQKSHSFKINCIF